MNKAPRPQPVPTRPQTIRTRARTAQAQAAEAQTTSSPLASQLLVTVRGLELSASIGVHPHEHTRLQPIRVDITLDLGPTPAPQDDRLAETVDYQAVCEATEALVAQGHVQLVETLADRIAQWCLRDSRVHAVTVVIEKPDALANAQSAGCSLTVTRPARPSDAPI